MTRTKSTFGAPPVCIGCFWEQEATKQKLLNKQLRGELLKFTAVKRTGRKPEPTATERDDEREVPDVLDEMSGMGKIRLDD